MAGSIGHGTTITFGTSALANELRNIGMSGLSRETSEDTHMGTTGGRTFLFDALYDPGGVDLEWNFDPTDLNNLNVAAETVTIDWGGLGVGNKWAFTAGISNIDISAPRPEVMVMSATLKASGTITIS